MPVTSPSLLSWAQSTREWGLIDPEPGSDPEGVRSTRSGSRLSSRDGR
jgi:hypothetical protein